MIKARTYTQEQIDNLKSQGWTWRPSRKYENAGIWIKTENRKCDKHGLTPHAVVLIEANYQKIASQMKGTRIKDEDMDSVCKKCCEDKTNFYQKKEQSKSEIDF